MPIETYNLIKDFAGPFATFVAASVAAVVTVVFQKRQTAIALQQATTASMAAITASNKLKFDVFHERFELYQVVVDYMSVVASLQDPDDLQTDNFFRKTAPIRWLFGEEVFRWIHKELMPEVLKIYEITLRSPQLLDNGQMDYAKTLADSVVRTQFFSLYESRDRVFERYLSIHF